ncbi:MAG: GTP 3',8-cyclase MoaA [Deltaproteobacteria bacterium]|nr:GTP 3',8-cyclase MoaA [Deltaproteobacteria bacterium]MBW1796506.1 GTP 3',8-cyclase MoaA [Deltaproteobacteria bacterium]MBW2330131.1 GTP 3',8-cyclase MoaA [Deltaproteobacteria bacterium]
MASNVDPYNRKITYLRVSVTDRCNLRCMYCTPVKDLKLLDHADILSYEEILKVIHVATDLGIKKVRLTGGEPLLRRNFVHLVESACRIPQIEDVSITTNGVLLQEMARPLFEAGLRRINVSLDTLNPLKYTKITRRECFDAVWNGLQVAEAIGFSPIKVNVVVIKGINDNELLRFADLSVRKPYHIRFIEYMPIGRDSNWAPEKYVPSDKIRSKLETFGPLRKIPRSIHDGPAERYQFQSAKGEIGFISALSHHFCPLCNRLRLTADGKLRPCLFADDEVDIKSPLRNGYSHQDLRDVFQQAIARKPRRHHAEILKKRECLRSMSTIGG